MHSSMLTLSDVPQTVVGPAVFPLVDFVARLVGDALDLLCVHPFIAIWRTGFDRLPVSNTNLPESMRMRLIKLEHISRKVFVRRSRCCTADSMEDRVLSSSSNERFGSFSCGRKRWIYIWRKRANVSVPIGEGAQGVTLVAWTRICSLLSIRRLSREANGA